MADSGKIRWGIVGAGRIARQFCRDIRHTSNATVSAVAARDINRAIDFADEFQIDKAFGSYDEIYTSDSVDAIYIATPHNHHFAQARDSLLAGKHVLVEKPFTVSTQECETLMELAKEKGLFLMEAMWTYFLPAVKRAKAWIDEGKIGDVVRVTADFGYPIPYSPDAREYDARLSGGCLLEMGIYPLAFSYLIFGKLPDSQEIQFEKAPNGVENDVAILARYDNRSALMATSYRGKLPNIAYVVGTKGWISIPDFWRSKSASLHVLEDTVETFDDPRLGDGFEFQIEAASDAILNGQCETLDMPLESTLALQTQMHGLLKRIHS